MDKKEKRPRNSYRNNASRAAADAILAVIAFLLVVRAIDLYKGQAADTDYRRIAFFTVVFFALSFVLRCTKRSMSNVLVNAVFFQLGSMFAKEFMSSA